MHVSVSICMSVHIHVVCMHACVSERVFGWVYSALYAHTLPGEIRLICQWCRSSSMINSPACWKQCYSALATCGTPIHCMCVSVFVCETAWISTLTSCTRCVDVVGFAAPRGSCVSRQLWAAYSLAGNPAQLHGSDRRDKLVGETQELCPAVLITSNITGH